MCRCSHNIAVLEWVVLHAGRHQSGDVGNVGHEVRADLVGDLAQLSVVPIARVGGGTTDEDLGLELLGSLGQTFVVDEPGLGVDFVGG